MNRARKKKVEVDKALLAAEMTAVLGSGTGGAVSAPARMPHPAATSAQAPPSPHTQERAQAREEFLEAMTKWKAAADDAREAEKELKMVERLTDAKWRRLEAGAARAKKAIRKNDHGFARRSYEAIIQKLQARYACAMAQLLAERRMSQTSACRMRVVKLENASLRCQITAASHGTKK